MAKSSPSAPKWERKAEERPEALYQAALDVFSKNGYHATRLEEVAKAAGVSKGTIYNYFENKEDLLRQALEHKFETVFLTTENALESFQGTAAEKLRFYLSRAWGRTLTENWGRFHKLILGEIANELPELFRFWIRKGALPSWRLAEKIIRDGQAAGEFRADADAAGMARFAMSGLTHQAFLQTHLGVNKLDDCPPDRILEAGLDSIISGLAAARGSGKKSGMAVGKSPGKSAGGAGSNKVGGKKK